MHADEEGGTWMGTDGNDNDEYGGEGCWGQNLGESHTKDEDANVKGTGGVGENAGEMQT